MLTKDCYTWLGKLISFGLINGDNKGMYATWGKLMCKVQELYSAIYGKSSNSNSLQSP